MVLYGINLVPLSEELRDVYPTLLSPFYAYDTEFEESERRSAAQLHLMIDRETDRVYSPKPAKSIFIADNPEEKEAKTRELEQAG